MSRRIPPLAALRSFEAAAHLESFAKAADSLCVSQSAVSQQIRILEDWLEVRLFTRLGNRVALTEEGRALGARLSEAFEIIAEACQQTTRSKGAAALHVGAETAFASRWLRPRLADFRAAHPDIQVYLKSGGDLGPPGENAPDIAIHFEKRLNEASLRGRAAVSGRRLSGLFAGVPEKQSGDPGARRPLPPAPDP